MTPDVPSLPSPLFSGGFEWNGGWPVDNNGVNFDRDTDYMRYLGSSKAYMAAVSPAFFTHYGPQTYNKKSAYISVVMTLDLELTTRVPRDDDSWLFDMDNWAMAQRWTQLISNRDKFDMVEFTTWNDLGESSYVYTGKANEPAYTTWAAGFDHTGGSSSPALRISLSFSFSFSVEVAG